ncbi:MAG: sigma-70 family RNA polymerase sigma factor [Cyanobacteria bacterium SZAS LIN-2]|nr:sigma-70 family RNA polymerase sigma factor [Cyanobacteria bacterium SZAS LIN-3]MBS1997644.1 sigma-70 family RNA polymerase sigma factor [Cyanobacteria bacterium SZAS LIN-2]MBS2010490.1 sigma-70 family RNA polymerase sigma factor [Cyanobacteria bacterium SZAS TMP-1]
MEPTDEELVEKFRATADMGIFKTLVRRYQSRIFAIALRTLGNNEEAEEAVQETFVKVHQNLPKYRQNSLFSSWLYRIAYNQCMDIMRMKQRRLDSQTIAFDPQGAGGSGDDASADGRDLVFQLADNTLNPAQSLDAQEQFEIVQASLNKLPESQKIVLILHDMQDLSYLEISEIVGTNIGTVRSRLHYGRLKLRELLAPYFSADSSSLSSPLTAR